MSLAENTNIAHKFELAGLGKAPFVCVGLFQKVHDCGDGITKPAGTCDFCSNGILNCYLIKSADGKTFIVGSECVNKTGDSGLVNTAKLAARQAKQLAKFAKMDADRAARLAARSPEEIASDNAKAEADKLSREIHQGFYNLRAEYENYPHPNAYLANVKKLTFADYLDFCMDKRNYQGQQELKADVFYGKIKPAALS